MNKGYFGPSGGLPVSSQGRDVFQRADMLIADDYDQSEPGGIDFRSLWSAVYRNRYLILAVLVVAMLIGLAATLLMTPIYRAQSTVQIEQQTRRVLGTEDQEADASAQDADRFLETQLDVIRSRYLAERVAQDLRLFSGAKFLQMMNEKVPSEPAGALDLRATQREAVLETISKNLSVALPRKSRIAQIRFESPDPILAGQIANSFAANFVTSNLQRKYDQSSYARDFLSRQLGDTKQRLETSERDLIAYARAARLIDTSSGVVSEQQVSGPRSLTTSSLVQMNNALSGAVSQRVQAQQRWEQARRASVMDLPEVLANPAVQELVQQRAEQVAVYEQERQRRREDFPTVRQAAARLAELDRQIQTLANNIKSGIQQEYRVANQQEQALSSKIGQLKGATLAEQDRSVRYNILKREVETNRQMYEGLLQRYRELSAEAGVTANNVAILDKAATPVGPVSPRPILNLGLAGVGGLVLALLLAFVRERFDDRIRSPQDVEGKLGASPLGVIPLLEGSQKPTEALSQPRSSLSEAYQSLRTSIELSSSDGLPSSLLFTSSQPGEGKSTSAFATAGDFARIGRRVLLIDGDLRRPSMHRVVALANDRGLSNALAGGVKSEELIQKTDLPNLDFLGTGPLPPNPAELLSSVRFIELLRELEATYDLVIFDAPPVMGLADAPLLASRAGGVVFVVEANRSHFGSAKTALRRLLAANARLLGVVLTKYNAKTTGYGEYYGYGYDYGSLPAK